MNDSPADSDSEGHNIVSRQRALMTSILPRVPRLSSSVRLKALMLELSFPVHSGPGHRGSGYNYGQKWTYLNGKYQEYGDMLCYEHCYLLWDFQLAMNQGTCHNKCRQMGARRENNGRVITLTQLYTSDIKRGRKLGYRHIKLFKESQVFTRFYFSEERHEIHIKSFARKARTAP